MRLLVTGAAGQVGVELAHQAAHAKIAVHAYTRDQLDITDKAGIESMITTCAPNLIINAAAYTDVDRAESESDLAFAVNADGAANLARSAAKRGIPIIHISTDYVFDGDKDQPYIETDATGPLSVYGASKLTGEQMISEICPRHVIVRSAWIYGVHGSNFVKTMLRIGQQKSEIRVVGDQLGSPTLAADLAEAILGMARAITARPDDDQLYGVFHCSGSGATSWHGFAEQIFMLAAPWFGQIPKVSMITTQEYPTAARRPPNSQLDCAKLSKVYGIEMRAWQSALAEMLTKLHMQACEEKRP